MRICHETYFITFSFFIVLSFSFSFFFFPSSSSSSSYATDSIVEQEDKRELLRCPKSCKFNSVQHMVKCIKRRNFKCSSRRTFNVCKGCTNMRSFGNKLSCYKNKCRNTDDGGHYPFRWLQGAKCKYQKPSVGYKLSKEQLVAKIDAVWKERAKNLGLSIAPKKHRIPIYWHIVRDGPRLWWHGQWYDNYLMESMVQIHKAFHKSNIEFVLGGVERPVIPKYYPRDADADCLKYGMCCPY